MTYAALHQLDQLCNLIAGGKRCSELHHASFRVTRSVREAIACLTHPQMMLCVRRSAYLKLSAACGHIFLGTIRRIRARGIRRSVCLT